MRISIVITILSEFTRVKFHVSSVKKNNTENSGCFIVAPFFVLIKLILENSLLTKKNEQACYLEKYFH